MTIHRTARDPGFTPADWVTVIVINLAWGLNLVAVKFTVSALPPFTAASLRMGIVFAACLPFFRIVPGQMKALLWLAALLGGLFMGLVNLSVMVTERVSAIAIASQLGAPFSLILAVIVLKEHIGRIRMIGIALAFAGCVVLAFDPHAASEGLGLTLTAVASFVWALASLIQRRLRDVPVPTLYAWIGLGGVVTLAPVALLFDPPIATLGVVPWTAWGGLAWSALASTLLGAGGMTWLLQRHPIAMVVPFTLAAPVVAVVASTLVFHTAVTAVMLLGGAMALAGVAIITVRTAERRTPDEVGAGDGAG